MSMEKDTYDRIVDKLSELKIHLNRLKEIREKMHADTLEKYKDADPLLKYSMERNLQLINDAEMDVLIRLYKEFGKEIAAEPLSMAKSLKSVLSSSLLNAFEKRRLLRDGLIHVYKEFSFDKEVFEQSNDAGDVESFIAEVKRLISK